MPLAGGCGYTQKKPQKGLKTIAKNTINDFL